jgi:hypothetical protein
VLGPVAVQVGEKQNRDDCVYHRVLSEGNVSFGRCVVSLGGSAYRIVVPFGRACFQQATPAERRVVVLLGSLLARPKNPAGHRTVRVYRD